MLDIFYYVDDTAPTAIYPLSLRDALPISGDRVDADGQVGADVAQRRRGVHVAARQVEDVARAQHRVDDRLPLRSDEHTSQLQSRQYLVWRLLLDKNKCLQYILFHILLSHH